jgi:hypothetical protein
MRTQLLLAALLALAAPAAARAQAAPLPFPRWQGNLPPGTAALAARTEPQGAAALARESAAVRRHTGTGLLIGGVVGAAATTVFLIGFCSDPDTSCGVDEVGRATVIIGVPCAAAGALIGWLVKTDE